MRSNDNSEHPPKIDFIVTKGGPLSQGCGSNETVDELEYDLIDAALFDVQTPPLPLYNETEPHSSKQIQDPGRRTMPDTLSLAGDKTDDSRLFLDITNTPLSSPIKSPAPLHFTSHCGCSEKKQSIDSPHTNEGADPSTSPHPDTPTSSSWLVNSPLRKTLSHVKLDDVLSRESQINMDTVDLTGKYTDACNQFDICIVISVCCP